MKRNFEISNLICYGYGSAFYIISQIIDLDVKYIVDRDNTKWGTKKGYEVIGWEFLQLLDLSEYNFLIMPFESDDIVNTLINAGIERKRIYFLKNILNDSQELRNEYDNLYNKYISNYKYKYRSLRLDQIGYVSQENFEDLYKKWLYEIPFFEYRDIDLKQLLSSDITLLLDFVFNPEIDIDLFNHPIHETYRIYGEGPILATMFPRNRPDYYERLNFIIKDFRNSVQILTYSDNKLGFINDMEYKEFHFKYEYKEHYGTIADEIIRQISKIFFNLSFYEYRWLDYSIKFYLCLIDFYIDILKLEFKIKLLLLPHYGEENIITQINKLESQSVVYQHGNFIDSISNRDYKNFAQYLYRYNFNVDYYLTWDEASKKSLQNILLNGESKDIRYLGNTIEMRYTNNKINRHFIVSLPGKVKNDNKMILNLLSLAENIAEKMNLTFDVRYHPLNRKNIRIDSIKFKKEVTIENFDINKYDFSVSYLTTLIREFYSAGLPSFEMGKFQTYSNGCFIEENELESLIRSLYYEWPKSLRLEKDTSQIQSNYSDFLKGLLEG